MRLGDKVRVKGYYQRNGRKPYYATENKSRYEIVECDREGFIAGKRNIHLKGFTACGSEDGYCFCSQETVSCWLVAVNMGQCLYVPTDCLTPINTGG
jgi:hypothetical protein